MTRSSDVKGCSLREMTHAKPLAPRAAAALVAGYLVDCRKQEKRYGRWDLELHYMPTSKDLLALELESQATVAVALFRALPRAGHEQAKSHEALAAASRSPGMSPWIQPIVPRINEAPSGGACLALCQLHTRRALRDVHVQRKDAEAERLRVVLFRRIAIVVGVVVLVVAGCSRVKRVAGLGCETACDCKPGYACAGGECLSGTVADYCCTSCPALAPSQQQCQRADGTRHTCGSP